MVFIRDLTVDDATEFLALNHKLYAESDFMVYSADEFNMPLEKLQAIITDIQSHENTNIFVALVDDEMVGFLSALGGKKPRIAHTGTGGMGVLGQLNAMGDQEGLRAGSR